MALKQKIGNQDTKHGLLDLPVYTGGRMKKPSKGTRKKIMGAIMAAHQAGMQKGAQQAAPPPPPGIAGLPPGGPAGPPPAMPGKPPGMKKGGAVKEKWVPPWIKKKEGGKKFAGGGSVRGGRGDGCAVKGHTKGKMC